VEKSELLSALAALTDDEKRALLGTPLSASAAASSPKFSPALDQVADEAIADVVNACRAGLKAITEATERGPDAVSVAEGEADAALARVSPVVAAAARANSRYRNKSLAHSLAVAITYLQSPQAEAKRAAKRRKVPQSKPAAAVAGGSK
jgi:hypothetical protein